MAPEVVSHKEYDEKCDVWSAGVILYLLICGRPPFCAPNKEDTMQLIKKGEVPFNNPVWKKVSPDAKNLVLKMLAKSPEHRISAHQARTHPWIIKACARPISNATSLTLPLENLRYFHTQDALQKAVLTFMASQLMDSDQEQALQKLFNMLDLDDNGQISREELMSGYKSISLNKEIAEKDIEEVLQHADLNENGVIDYNEFLVANLKRQQVSSEKNLKEAFIFFDQKKKGYIDIDDLRRIFGGICEENTIMDIVDDVDMNHDGQVSIRLLFFEVLEDEK